MHYSTIRLWALDFYEPVDEAEYQLW